MRDHFWCRYSYHCSCDHSYLLEGVARTNTHFHLGQHPPQRCRPGLPPTTTFLHLLHTDARCALNTSPIIVQRGAQCMPTRNGVCVSFLTSMTKEGRKLRRCVLKASTSFQAGCVGFEELEEVDGRLVSRDIGSISPAGSSEFRLAPVCGPAG